MLLVIAIRGGFLAAGKAALEMLDPYWLTALRFGTAALVFIGLRRPTLQPSGLARFAKVGAGETAIRASEPSCRRQAVATLDISFVVYT